jgi:hypothetical protein
MARRPKAIRRYIHRRTLSTSLISMIEPFATAAKPSSLASGIAKQLIAIRLSPRLLSQLREMAAKQGKPYQKRPSPERPRAAVVFLVHLVCLVCLVLSVCPIGEPDRPSPASRQSRSSCASRSPSRRPDSPAPRRAFPASLTLSILLPRLTP